MCQPVPRRNERPVLSLWSESHRQTLIDIFVAEPFDFMAEHEKAAIARGLALRIAQL